MEVIVVKRILTMGLLLIVVLALVLSTGCLSPGGGSTANPPSRFLEDIPKHLITRNGQAQKDETRISGSVFSWNRISSPLMPDLILKAGDHVRHETFGEGVIVSFRPVNNDAEVVVVFDGLGLKKLLLSFARLEKLS